MNIPIAHYGSMDLDSLEMLQDIVGTLQVKVPNDSLAKVNGMKKGDVVKITKDKMVRWYDGKMVRYNSAIISEYT